MGLFDQYATPKKNYYGLLAFGETAKHERRVAADSDIDGVKILAGHDSKGKGAVLVSAFKANAATLELRLAGMENPQILCVNPELNLEPVETRMDNGRLVLDNASGSSVFLIKGDTQRA